MSKIAEQKGLEAYPIINPPYNTNIEAVVNAERAFKREGYIVGYDQAMKDMVKDSEHLKYLSDEMGYAYACGCKKTMQDFLEKAMEYFKGKPIHHFWVEQFKNYMENEEM